MKVLPGDYAGVVNCCNSTSIEKIYSGHPAIRHIPRLEGELLTSFGPKIA